MKTAEAKRVKKLASKELTLHEFYKCAHDITNSPITKEKESLGSIAYKDTTVTTNKS